MFANGFNKNGNLVAEIFMSLGKIIAGVLSILLFENNYSRGLDKSNPTTIYLFLSGYFLRTYIVRNELSLWINKFSNMDCVNTLFD